LVVVPRRKPRNKPRPPQDVAYNRQVARARIVVEHTIRRIRCYQAVTQTDRHHRHGHDARMYAVGGLVNRQIDHRCAA
jgi:DDE superfamily endonuclease